MATDRRTKAQLLEQLADMKADRETALLQSGAASARARTYGNEARAFEKAITEFRQHLARELAVSKRDDLRDPEIESGESSDWTHALEYVFDLSEEIFAPKSSPSYARLFVPRAVMNPGGQEVSITVENVSGPVFRFATGISPQDVADEIDARSRVIGRKS